jgi:ABC-2 type transport system permease protein
MKRLKKYMFIYKSTLMENLQYMMNILFGFISFIVLLFIFLNLWNYIYSDTTNLIAGYTKTQMIWYVIITEILWFGTSNGTLTNQFSIDIKSGTIAYGINKPYNYMFYLIAKHFGEITIKLCMFVGLGLLFGVTLVGALPNFKLIHFPLICITLFLGILINSFIRISISILSFWIEDAGPFHWIYNKFIIVIGTLFPIEIFPLWAQPIIRFSPIFVITYGPAKLIIDFSMEMFLSVLTTQILYIACFLMLLSTAYQKGVKKINVNGG